jgi:hypothetical protein
LTTASSPAFLAATRSCFGHLARSNLHQHVLVVVLDGLHREYPGQLSQLLADRKHATAARDALESKRHKLKVRWNVNAYTTGLILTSPARAESVFDTPTLMQHNADLYNFMPPALRKDPEIRTLAAKLGLPIGVKFKADV